jgi:hypothetical protein
MKWFEKWSQSGSLTRAYYFQLIVLLALGIYGISAVRMLEKNFEKLFSQKLIPAMDISRMLELQFQNRFHLEEYLNSDNALDRQAYLYDIQRNNHSIDSLLDVYLSGAALMEKEETQDLKDFYRVHRSYLKEENYIIHLNETGDSKKAIARYRFESSLKFNQAVDPMKKFEEVELRLGKNILGEVKYLTQRISWILFSAMIMAILVAIWISLRVSRNYMEG